MATATTYTSLKASVTRYLERGDSDATDPVVYDELPRLINLAERRCARELKIQGYIEVVTGAFVAGQSVYAKPDRWRDTVSINFGTGVSNNVRNPVYSRGYEYLRVVHPNPTEQGVPELYADYNAQNWLFAPTPDAAYPYEVLYYALPPLLDDSNQTNYLTEYAPDLLLYATLLEATPFLKNDERIQVWQNFYDRAAAMLNGEDLSKILDRTAVRKEA